VVSQETQWSAMISLRKIKAKIKSEWENASKAEKIFFGYCLFGPLGLYLFPIYLGIRKLLKRRKK